MKRRHFLIGASALTSASSLPAIVLPQTTYRKARISVGRHSGTKKRHSYKKVKDPTDLVGGRVERFELRGGECSDNSDCTPRRLSNRMVTRARVERVLETDMGDGDVGMVRYSVFLPSSEYNIVDSVRTALGQVLAGYKRGKEYDSFPVFTFNTDRNTRDSRLYAAMSEAQIHENEKVGYTEYTIGSLRTNMLDRWINAEIRFRLSSSRNGYAQVIIDGRSLGTFRGRTILPDGFLEVRYGIYQTGTNEHPRGRENIPTQVAYYSKIGVYRAS